MMNSSQSEENKKNLKQRVHLFVEGRVQGVGFRYFAVETANQFHIYGWVRNTHKREVEIMAEGERTELDQFMNQIRQGPGAAFVQNLRIEWLTASDEFSRFSVIPTY